ncbi:hypothetical protein [Feifania hominis]|uniref:Uncharacterized protein n=1 Tax=Feifania hominis TaxID=2763660 RepID=A0A926DG93_9FIRM|nr:hypothetical protein [Feifania hominis]MBC8537282.1 hypothetical protein [Feifania hominis]
MRLIDADDFDTKLFNDGFFGGLAAAIGNTPRKRKFTIGEFRGMLKNAPTIDAVTVVRCRECKHWDGFHSCHCHKADDNGTPIFMREYDFCSHGERMDKEVISNIHDNPELRGG